MRETMHSRLCGDLFPSQGRPNFPPSPSKRKPTHIRCQNDAHLRMPNFEQVAEASQDEKSMLLITRTATNLKEPIIGVPVLTTGKIACSPAACNSLNQVGDIYTVDIEHTSILSRQDVRQAKTSSSSRRNEEV